MLLDPIIFTLLMMALILLSRTSRASYMHRLERERVIEAFRASRSQDGRFRADMATTVYEEWRIDRWGPGGFYDIGCPVCALRIARTPENSYHLWTYSDSLQPEPKLERLDLKDDKSAHKLGRGLLARTFPHRRVWRATWRAWKAKVDARPVQRRPLRKR